MTYIIRRRNEPPIHPTWYTVIRFQKWRIANTYLSERARLRAEGLRNTISPFSRIHLFSHLERGLLSLSASRN